MSYFAVLLTIFVIAAISAMALNLAIGHAGQLTITQGALMGVGAYTTGLLSIELSLNPAVGLAVSAVSGVLVGLAFAAAAIRLREYDFVLVSLILQMMTIEIIRRVPATGGSSGLSSIGRPSVFGNELVFPVPFAGLALVVAVIAMGALWRISNSMFATTLRGFRDSEASIAALGKNTNAIRLLVGAIAGFGGGLAGGLQASFVGFISPDDFSVFLSVLIIVYLLVGGVGNATGVLVGVALLIAVPEIIKEIPAISVALQGPLQRIIYGLIVMGFIMFRPEGLLPEKPILHLPQRDHDGGSAASEIGLPTQASRQAAGGKK